LAAVQTAVLDAGTTPVTCH